MDTHPCFCVSELTLRRTMPQPATHTHTRKKKKNRAIRIVATTRYALSWYACACVRHVAKLRIHFWGRRAQFAHVFTCACVCKYVCFLRCVDDLGWIQKTVAIGFCCKYNSSALVFCSCSGELFKPAYAPFLFSYMCDNLHARAH